ncbi:MAG: IPT/TIG domain, FG-GAP repeat-containing protein [Acidobacteria bacterium OLB17]|nr:MAG: IPT/TIG domain, FG-GAP repeat-containing protein [Acidobacteria bacterium OLB17]MCZ2390002.1 VCBS repeat-containing protein [Acidobacteriota bacterium]
MNRVFQALLVATVTIFALSPALGQRFSAWSDPVNMESIPGTSTEFNTPYGDGCPIQAPDGLSFYIASNRPGGMGGQDIWVSTRASTDAPWGAFTNVGAPINSASDDFCPSPAPGNMFFFISTRPDPGACGGGDIYFTKFKDGAWQTPENLGCEINSSGAEWSPSYFQDENGHGVLYFASDRPNGRTPGDIGLDIYYTEDFGPAQLAPGLNSEYDDARPNVRHDGLEIVFDSTRPGTLGGPDIWTAKRSSTSVPWEAPVHLPAPINSAAGDTRASLSWDGKQMVVGSSRPGSEIGGNGNPSGDVWVMTRNRLPDPNPSNADFDGDGISDVSVFRPTDGTWHIMQSSTGQYLVQPFGTANDKPVPGDYDGDGATDYAVFRPAEGMWYIRYSSDSSVHILKWGISTDVLAPADYDGDGKTDLAVYRSGVWYILRSSDGSVEYRYFGVSTDIPVASAQ